MKLNLITIILLTGLLNIFFSCKQEKNILTLSPVPVIDSVVVPAKWNTRLSILYKVEVKVLDAQGFANIDSVRMDVVDNSSAALLFSDNLHERALHPLVLFVSCDCRCYSMDGIS